MIFLGARSTRSSKPQRRKRIILPAVLFPLALAAGLGLLVSCTFDLDYDKYAIVYGISDYPGTGNDLTVAHSDAEAVGDLLISQGFQVVLRVTEDISAVPVNDAHIDNLNADFNDAATTANLGLEDLFLFYFSGHGTQISPGTLEQTPGNDEEDEAIVLVDDAPSAPSDQRSTVYVTDDELAQLLRAIPCARKVVILDSCFAGGFISNALAADAIPPEYYDGPKGFFGTLGDAIYLYANFQDYGSDIPPGEALVIAATGEQDVAYENEDNGVMTGFLLESADKADYNFDGYITVSESYFYIYRNINKRFNMLYGSSGYAFFPHTSGGPVDYILFTK